MAITPHQQFVLYFMYYSGIRPVLITKKVRTFETRVETCTDQNHVRAEVVEGALKRAGDRNSPFLQHVRVKGDSPVSER